MCNYNKQSQETKEFIHLFMTKAAQNVGGVNFLLSLLEAMKQKKPNPFLAKECFIESTHLKIKWNKVVFKDKFDVLESIVYTHKTDESESLNILEHENTKQRKKILNMVRTLTPLEFVVTTKDEDENGFKFKVFDIIEENKVTLNPVFVAFFFCSVEFTKKSLKYKEA